MNDWDDGEGVLQETYVFAQEAFAEKHKAEFDRYIAKVVVGHPKYDSFAKAFGNQYFAAQMMPKYINAMESNPYYDREFERVKSAMKIGEVWTIPDAIHEMLALARSPFTKCSTKQKVIDQLNVLAGHTLIDPDGNTRAGRDLTDFYKNAEALKAQLPAPPKVKGKKTE